jgi:hypothetical protein
MSKSTIIWSYSIYGDDIVTYYAPVVSNILLARQEGAIVAISTTLSDEAKVRDYFSEYLDEIRIVSYDSLEQCSHPKILRFLIPNVIKSDFYFFKDSDSIVTMKEARIMRDWMATVTPVAMIIRDHPLHVAPIMAGMFGIASTFANYLTNSAYEAFFAASPRFRDHYSYDQDWLMTDVYPELVECADVYSSFLFYSGENVRRIERESSGSEFIGAQIRFPYPLLLERAAFYKWYGPGLLCAPSQIKKSFFYGRVRPTLVLAYLYTLLKTLLGSRIVTGSQDDR